MNGITMRMLTRPREEGEEERRPEETRRRRERDWPEERRTEAYGYPMERRMTADPYRHQPVFAGGLIAAILPIRVAQRSRLRDQRIHRRLLIRRRGRNENILIGSPAEKANVPLQLFHVKNDEVRHDVKMEIAQQLAHLFFVVHIHTKGFGPRRQRMISPVQQIKLPAFFQAALADRIGDRSRAANKQRFSHEGFLLSISSPKGKKC